MEYRSLGKSGISVSRVGLGCEHLQGSDYETIRSVIDAAINNGVNIMDIFMSEPQVRTDIGRALSGKRDKAVIQGHIGAAWENGQYLRTRDAHKCDEFFTDLMKRLRTDYIDVGFLHYVDEIEDFDLVCSGGMLDYTLTLKKKGVIRAVGLSTHNPVVAVKAAQSGFIDVIMFSLNPMFDLLDENKTLDELFAKDVFDPDASGLSNPVRSRLYSICEQNGVGITVMKGLAGGRLLRASASPFNTALSVVQCIHYALTRPAVASILVGCKTAAQVLEAVSYETAGDREKDFSDVFRTMPQFLSSGKCVYCNHCLPCPAGIDIAAVFKLYDLACENGNASPLASHYDALSTHASCCTGCASCEKNCPFSVPVVERMEKASELFGK